MKESRDTEGWQEGDGDIAQDINLCATLQVTHITVDTDWAYPDYMLRWAKAIHAAGKHVWFRTVPTPWDQSATGNGPSDFMTNMTNFINAHAASGLWRPGDIWDPTPELDGLWYWGNLAAYLGQRAPYSPSNQALWASHWTYPAPNPATDAWNAMLLRLKDTADAAFTANHISGVVTGVMSVIGTQAAIPLYDSTATALGAVTYDSYPEGPNTTPSASVAARLTEINAIHQSHPSVPIVVGEMGYSNYQPVTDAQQEAVLQAEFTAMEQLPFLGGVNYWVGPGNEWSGGHTHIFGGQRGSWTLRPAANDLAAFYALERAGISPSPTPSPTASPEPSPTSPTTHAPTSGQAAHQSPRARPTPTSGGNAGAHLSGVVTAPKGGGGSGSGGTAPAGAGRGRSGATPVIAGLIPGLVVALLAAIVGRRLATRRKRTWRYVHRV